MMPLISYWLYSGRMMQLEVALLGKVMGDPNENRNRLYVHNLLVFKSWGMELDDEEEATIGEYVLLYGNPLAPKPQVVLKV